MTAGDWLQLPIARPFYDALLDREITCRWRAEDVILLMCGECDLMIGVPPNAGGYSGLTQIGKSELSSLGWKVSDGPFHLSPAATQVDFAGRYFEGWRKTLKIDRWTSAGQLWAANLMPNTLATPNAPVFDRSKWRAGWEANRWLDLNDDGLVTLDELQKALLTRAMPRSQPRYDIAMRTLALVRGMRPIVPSVEPDMRDPNLREEDIGEPPPDAA